MKLNTIIVSFSVSKKELGLFMCSVLIDKGFIETLDEHQPRIETLGRDKESFNYYPESLQEFLS